MLKGQGQRHVTVNKPVISRIYVVAHTWSLCSAQILVDWVNPRDSFFKKSVNISAIVQHMSVSFVSLRSTRVHLQINTRKVVENHCDITFKKYCKVVVSKEVCSHDVTLPLNLSILIIKQYLFHTFVIKMTSYDVSDLKLY